MRSGFAGGVTTEAYNQAIEHLDISQRAAALSAAPNLVVRASAGTGKTTALISAICAYKYNNINAHCCAITFTRAARAEMEVRLQQLGVYDVEVATIHAWSARRLKELAAAHHVKLNIIEEYQIRQILIKLVQSYLVKHTRIRSVNIDILYNYITGTKKMDITPNFRRTLNALEERYIQYKKDNMLYDFTDYPRYLYDMLQAFDERISDIQGLFVDEFQDVDPIQLEIFNLVDADKKFYIGDPWQSIYQFRNADGAVFEKLPTFEVVKLKDNYRSYQEIINYAVTVYETLKDKAAAEIECCISDVESVNQASIKCRRGTGGQIAVVNPFGGVTSTNMDNLVNNNYAPIGELFDYIMSCRPMILCRLNKQASWIKSLGYPNADTIHSAKGLEYPNVLVLDTPILGLEDLNVAYVALTRARDKLFVINWQQFESLFTLYMNKL